ncbi:MAG: hypothetical protein KIS94_01845 [Chitinophagales bacterium]|nr:hypothetical protein [Chitinophagales bacterium]
MFHKPFEVYLLCLLLLLLSLSAFYGGGALILKPDGSLLQMEPWLNEIPFPNYLIPGIILFVMNGLLPLLALIGLLFRPKWEILNRLNVYNNCHWAWTFSLYSGIICIAWIIAQQFLTQYFIAQPIVALAGLLIIVFSLMPRLMKHYQMA